MIKLIVSDFDGTLLPYGESRVSEAVRQRLKKAIENNITVAVASGRTYGELAALLPEFADSVYFVCCDGAHYVKGGRSLYERQIEHADLNGFFAEKSDGFSFILHGANRNYSVGNIPDEAKLFNAVPITRIGEVKEKIFKITSYGKELKFHSYSGLRTHWDGGKNSMAQFVNRFANKGAAVSDLQVRLMLTKFDTACIGDSGNDVAMVKNAKLSFAVGNRSAHLAEISDRQVARVEDAFDEIFSD